MTKATVYNPKAIFQLEDTARNLIVDLIQFQKTPKAAQLDEFEAYLVLAAMEHLWHPATAASDMTAVSKWTMFLAYAHLETDYEMPTCFYLACYHIGNQSNSFMPRLFGKIYNEKPATVMLGGHCKNAIDKPEISMKLVILSIDRQYKTHEERLTALFIWMDRHTYRDSLSTPASTGTIGIT